MGHRRYCAATGWAQRPRSGCARAAARPADPADADQAARPPAGQTAHREVPRSPGTGVTIPTAGKDGQGLAAR